MPPILLVTGSPASGKSTISRVIAQRSSRGLHIPVDDLRTMVVSGVVHPGPTWSRELIQQLELARLTAVHTAMRYREAGFLVAIDDFWDPYSKMQEYEALNSERDVFRLLLKPPMEIAIARLHERQPHSEMRDHLDNGIRMLYTEYETQALFLAAQRWHVLDTSTCTADDCVNHILSIIENRAS